MLLKTRSDWVAQLFIHLENLYGQRQYNLFGLFYCLIVPRVKEFLFISRQNLLFQLLSRDQGHQPDYSSPDYFFGPFSSWVQHFLSSHHRGPSLVSVTFKDIGRWPFKGISSFCTLGCSQSGPMDLSQLSSLQPSLT